MQETGEAATAFYELSDNVQVQARIDSSVDRVAVWLGANVMVEYSYEEAQALQQEQLDAATTKVVRLENCRAKLRLIHARRHATTLHSSLFPLTRPFNSARSLWRLQKTNTADLAFLRDQIITTEVNSARVYNFIVRTERAKKMAELAAAGVALPGPAPGAAAAVAAK